MASRGLAVLQVSKTLFLDDAGAACHIGRKHKHGLHWLRACREKRAFLYFFFFIFFLSLTTVLAIWDGQACITNFRARRCRVRLRIFWPRATF